MKLSIGFSVIVIITITAATRTPDVEKKIIKNRFEPNWESLMSRELPTWYDEGKVGIFIHWGVYSVPSFGSEWFWYNWRSQWEWADWEAYVEFMEKNFKPGFTYQEFARDFTGEHFNATEWVQLFAESGAKYMVFTSKHHDGYTLWPSKYSYSWNSMDIGLKRDILSELAQAVRVDNRLRFGLYYSLLEWYNPMYLSDKDSRFSQQEFVEKKAMPELKELVMTYRPDIVWSDGEWEAPYRYWNATEFLAWLYNESPVSETVISNDRWGENTMCQHGGFFTCHDRYNPGVLPPYKWENAMTIDRGSWGYRQKAKLDAYLTSEQLIRELVITVSCGGNILVNVGPDETGLIQPIFVERLRDMGRWLSINGDAIYSSRPWIYQNDTTTPNVWYTTQPSATPLRRNVYAIVLDYPYDAESVELFSPFGQTDEQTTVAILGYPEILLEWRVTNNSVVVTFPSKAQLDKRGLDFAWTLVIDIPDE